MSLCGDHHVAENMYLQVIYAYKYLVRWYGCACVCGAHDICETTCVFAVLEEGRKRQERKRTGAEITYLCLLGHVVKLNFSTKYIHTVSSSYM